MAPEVFFDRKLVDDKVLETLKGQKVTGYLHWPGQEEQPPIDKLRENLEFVLTETDPDGFLTAETSQRAWERRREVAEQNIGTEDLAFVFPERGHRAYMTLLNDLKRAGIISVHDLVARKENLQGISRIGYGGSKYKAIVLITEHFANKA